MTSTTKQMRPNGKGGDITKSEYKMLKGFLSYHHSFYTRFPSHNLCSQNLFIIWHKKNSKSYHEHTANPTTSHHATASLPSQTVTDSKQTLKATNGFMLAHQKVIHITIHKTVCISNMSPSLLSQTHNHRTSYSKNGKT